MLSTHKIKNINNKVYTTTQNIIIKISIKVLIKVNKINCKVYSFNKINKMLHKV